MDTHLAFDAVSLPMALFCSHVMYDFAQLVIALSRALVQSGLPAALRSCIPFAYITFADG